MANVMVEATSPGFHGGKLRKPGDEPFEVDEAVAAKSSWMSRTDAKAEVKASAEATEPKAEGKKRGRPPKKATEPKADAAATEGNDSGGK